MTEQQKFWQNLASDPRAGELVEGHLSALQREYQKALEEHELAMRKYAFTREIASLAGHGGWEALKQNLLQTRADILEQLAVAQGPQVLIKQIEAQVYRRIIELVEEAPVLAEQHAQDARDAREQADNLKAQLEMHSGGQ